MERRRRSREEKEREKCALKECECYEKKKQSYLEDANLALLATFASVVVLVVDFIK